MRVFIAIDFEQWRELFEGLQKRLDRNSAKMTLTRSFHLTLKFLDEVDEKQVKEITERLSKVKFAPFDVTLNSVGVFPKPSSIRVIWAGFEDEGKISELQEKVDEALVDLFPGEDFKAHITLARVKEVIDKDALKKNLESVKVEKRNLLVKEFKLIKSTLLPTGPVYEEIGTFKAE